MTPPSTILSCPVCACGCGEPLVRDSKGRIHRFKYGHAQRAARVDMKDAAPFKIGGVYCKLLPLTQGLYAIVEAVDFDSLNLFFWKCGRGKKTHYPSRRQNLPDGTGTTVLLHRQILGFPKCDVDHRDHDGLNCMRSNLRLANRSLNGGNRIRGTNNRGTYKGVFLHKRDRKYVAHIVKDGKRRYLGYHATAVEAARAYDRAARDMYGEFACLNFPSAVA